MPERVPVPGSGFAGVTPDQPLVSAAIPLHRSRHLVDVIASNIERVDYPAVESLISDRHLDGDALDVLAERFAGSPTERTIQVGWVYRRRRHRVACANAALCVWIFRIASTI
jgi:hypothetical protein